MGCIQSERTLKASFASHPLWFHSSVNIRKIKIVAYIYINFSPSLVEKLPRQSHLQANREFTHGMCSNSGKASMAS